MLYETASETLIGAPEGIDGALGEIPNEKSGYNPVKITGEILGWAPEGCPGGIQIKLLEKSRFELIISQMEMLEKFHHITDGNAGKIHGETSGRISGEALGSIIDGALGNPLE